MALAFRLFWLIAPDIRIIQGQFADERAKADLRRMENLGRLL
jgi:hypothetical protein